MEARAGGGASGCLARGARRGAAHRALPVRPAADALRADAAPRGRAPPDAAAAHRVLGARPPAAAPGPRAGDGRSGAALLRSNSRPRRSAAGELRAHVRRGGSPRGPAPLHGLRGRAGRRLLETAMAAREQTLLRGSTWRLLAGINCSEGEFRALARLAKPGIVLERSRADFQQLLASCALSVSQAGYNTVAETLQARVRTVLVPFAAGGESEQSLRAQL